MSSQFTSVGDLKKGHYVVLDGEPCRVVEISKSKPGKHGAAKVRLVAIGVFDGAKRTVVMPADALVEIPIIEKKDAQVTAVMGETVQLMDLKTYEVFELPMPSDPDLAGKLKPGVEVEYWEAKGRRQIVRVK